jgi:putative ABC transport system permease protein
MLTSLIGILDATAYNSLGFFLLGLGILVSIRFAGYPDLTVDGSFTLGAALYAVCVKAQLPFVIAFIFAFLGGGFAGALTATINSRLKIGKIISSVLVMLALVTSVPYITGGTTVGLLTEQNFLGRIQAWDILLTRRTLPAASFSLHIGFICFTVALCSIIALLAGKFFLTRIGVQIRYLGSSVSSGLLSTRSKKYMLLMGLALGNALVASGGAIEAERNGGFSQNMGFGVILIGLAILILGESLVKMRVRRDNLHVGEYVVALIAGVLVYSFGIQLLLRIGLTFVDVRLTTTALLLVLLAWASRKHPNSARLF